MIVMENKTIAGSKFKPHIEMDAHAGTITLTGDSYPENSVEFYRTMFDWIKTYFEEGGKILTIDFKLEYFNSSSSKSFHELFDLLTGMKTGERAIHINWYYKEGDYDIMDSGEEYKQDFDLHFELIEY